MSINQHAEIVLAISHIQTRLSKRIDGQLSFHGISFTEFMVMHHLNHSVNHTLRRIELAEKIGLSASGITRMLMPMQKIGLVEKEANSRDARVSLVKLTDAGKKILGDAENTLNAASESILGALTDKQRGHLLQFIEAIHY